MDGGDEERAELQEQLDDLRRRVDVNHGVVEELVASGKLDREIIDDLVATGKLDRADIDQLVATGKLDRADIDALQAENEVDREIIATLAAEGLIAREHVRQLQEALVSARRIGAAIGIVMAAGKLSEEDAFHVLRGASQNTNRKLRDVAEDVVRTGDVSEL